MGRHLPTVLVVVLVAATAAAFVRTEALKLEPNPIGGPRVDKDFSPVCRCSKSRAHISFRLRRGDRVSVAVVDSNGHVVARLARNRKLPAGRASFLWDGRDSDGEVAEEGAYRPRLELARHGRMIVLPNPIRVDTTRPRMTLVSASPRTISPDGDGRHDGVRVEYRVDGPAQAILLVAGKQRARSRFRPLHGTISWYGRVGGRSLTPGPRRLELVAEDAAGNRSAPSRPVTILIRYVELRRRKIFVAPGRRFVVPYDTDATAVRWRLGRKHGVARRGRFVVRAPQRRGRFTLVVSARGHRAHAAVYVGRRSAAERRPQSTRPVSGQAR